MSGINEILRAMRQQIPVQLTSGKVQSVNEQDMTCEVAIEGHAKRTGVRLRAIISGTDGFVVIPQVGSYVLVALIDNRPESSVVLATSTVSGFIMKSQGESLKKIIADLIDAINQITVNVTSPGNPSGMPINAAAFIAIKQRLNLLLKE